MTTTQISTALIKYGYRLNTWICPYEYGQLLLTHDSPLVINKNMVMLRFNAKTEDNPDGLDLIEIVRGHLNSEGDFVSEDGVKFVDTDTFDPKKISYYKFSEIAGFLGRAQNAGILNWTRH